MAAKPWRPGVRGPHYTSEVRDEVRLRSECSRTRGVLIGLGCMRLSSLDEEAAIAVIHAALGAGATLLDTADVYAPDDLDIGHNERLVARALASWPAGRSGVEVATKAGLTRPGGRRWQPDGRAKHLRAAAEASRARLGVDAIDLLQLHVVDPRVALETSVRALAALQRDGVIRRIGLSNVTVAQIEAARRIADISAVQVSLGPLDATNLRNGVAEYCRDHGIRLIAYSPLGGKRSGTLARDPVLLEVGARLGATPHEVALAWLLDLDPCVVPIPGATRVETARSIGRVTRIAFEERDRAALDARFPAGRLLRVPRPARAALAGGDGEVVLVMGMPGAGKSTLAAEFAASGYERLNRDARGGRLSDLVRDLDAALSEGRRRFVLDNTYASRAARNEVVECAWRHGVPVRCVWPTTSLADAQVNAVNRLLDVHGSLPTPEELRARAKSDHRYLGPDALFRYERQVEPPSPEEGFTAIERPAFRRTPPPGRAAKGLLLELDGVVCTGTAEADVALVPDRRDTLARRVADGWRVLAQAWRPQIARGELTVNEVEAGFARVRDLLALPIDIAYCPHDAGPAICWCRKPLPGLALEQFARHGIDPAASLVVGRTPADRTLAERLGASYVAHDDFFGGPTE